MLHCSCVSFIVVLLQACSLLTPPYCAGAHCAREGGTCKCNGAVTYGAKGKFKTKHAGGSIGCNNGVFGDPVPGTVKACYCKGGVRADI